MSVGDVNLCKWAWITSIRPHILLRKHICPGGAKGTPDACWRLGPLWPNLKCNDGFISQQTVRQLWQIPIGPSTP